MDHPLHLTDIQRMLRDSLERYLSERYDTDTRRHTLATAHESAPLWRVFSHDLGMLGAAFTEDEGGLGGGFADHLAILESLGRHLAAEPYLSTMVLAGGLLRRVPGQAARQRLHRLITGEAVTVVAHAEPGARHSAQDVRCTLGASGKGWRLQGSKSMVYGAPWADEVIVVARAAGTPLHGPGLSLVCLPLSTPGIRRRDHETVDGGRASELRFDDVPVTEEQLLGLPGTADALVEQVQDEATLAMGAEAIGLLDRLLADSIAYARERRQFGAPIASFQVLQHRLADMHLALEQARAMVYQAVPALSASPAERMRVVSSTQVAVARACRAVGQGAVQIHGGMGMTDELAVGHCFRRATFIERRFGTVDHHLHRVAVALDD